MVDWSACYTAIPDNAVRSAISATAELLVLNSANTELRGKKVPSGKCAAGPLCTIFPVNASDYRANGRTD